MKRCISLLFLVTLVAAPLHHASAEAPDIREVRPVVMLLVDSSGSMDWMETSSDTPDCSRGERSRFHMVVEAMTGTWERGDWSCDRNQIPDGPNQREDGILDVYRDRMLFGMMTFDSDYDVWTDNSGMYSYGPPRAWDDGDDRNNQICVDGGCTTICQDVCEQYNCRNVCTRWRRGSCRRWSQVCDTRCHEECTTNCSSGLSCVNDTRGSDYDNVGARHADAPSGGLISIGDGEALTATQLNARIQDSLISVNPSGGTPIAGQLADLGWYFENDPDIVNDPFAECRRHYGILLSDGQPNTDRRTGCQGSGESCPYLRPVDEAAKLCELNSVGECTGVVDGLFAIGMDLTGTNGLDFLDDVADVGGTEQAYFAEDQATLIQAFSQALDAISATATSRTSPAFSGGGASSANSASQFNAGFVVGDGTGWAGRLERTRFECNSDLEPEAQPITRQDRYHELLDSQAGRDVRTIVAGTPSSSSAHLVGTGAGSIPTLDYEENAAGTERGVGGRPRECGGVGGGGAFDEVGHVVEDELDLAPNSFSLSNGGLNAAMLGVENSERAPVINWALGNSGRDSRLGAIYHSSPVVVGPPAMDIPDESYNLFRRLPDVAGRPTVVYVGSNDGILHAFLAEDWDDPNGGTRHAGEELWGFVPPILLEKLEAGMAGNQFMVDGTPVVRDVFFQRTPGQDPDANIYHTVLIMGLRAGGAGYFALDVTDPTEPEFLWQFTDASMGNTFGTPGIGQVLVDVGGTSDAPIREERALVLLGGGAVDDITETDPGRTCGGPLDLDGDPTTYEKPVGCTLTGRGPFPVRGSSAVDERDQNLYKCWDPTGRMLYFLDVATGEVITVLDDTVFNAPLNGGIALHLGELGTIATRAFTTDADGVMWRVDFSNPDYREWDAEPFFDIFHGTGRPTCGDSSDDGIRPCDPAAIDGQPAYYAPIVTTDPDGRVTVLQGTGNIDILDDPRATNRVVSLTEMLEFDDGDALNYTANGREYTARWRLNWEITLDRGEQITGPIQLFNGQVYFATFDTPDIGASACDFGSSQLYGVHYLINEQTQNCDSLSDGSCDVCTTDSCSDVELPLGVFDDGSGTPSRTRWPTPLENQLVLGVGITQRQTCSQFDSDVLTDPFLAGYYRTRIAEQGSGGFELSYQTSGGGVANAGGSIPSVSESLAAPQAFTRVSGWASGL